MFEPLCIYIPNNQQNNRKKKKEDTSGRHAPTADTNTYREIEQPMLRAAIICTQLTHRPSSVLIVALFLLQEEDLEKMSVGLAQSHRKELLLLTQNLHCLLLLRANSRSSVISHKSTRQEKILLLSTKKTLLPYTEPLQTLHRPCTCHSLQHTAADNPFFVFVAVTPPRSLA